MTTTTMDIDALYREVGSRIRAEREVPGFTQQAELAAELGLARTSVVNIESGRQRLLLHTLASIAWAPGVPVSCLLPPQLCWGPLGAEDEEEGRRA